MLIEPITIGSTFKLFRIGGEKNFRRIINDVKYLYAVLLM